MVEDSSIHSENQTFFCFSQKLTTEGVHDLIKRRILCKSRVFVKYVNVLMSTSCHVFYQGFSNLYSFLVCADDC